MTRDRALRSAFAHVSRPLALGGLAAFTAFAIAACGTEELSGVRPQGGPEASADSAVSAPAPSAQQAAFTAMLDEMARSCPSPGGGPLATKPPVHQRERRIAPGETPPAEPIEPLSPTGPETVLTAREWCASVRHEHRLLLALQAIPEPTPAKVRRVLNELGYIDAHIHDLAQDGERTRFHLDLRQEGGTLCETGTAAGAESDVAPCAARATGAFTVEVE
ncbi:hypothetical protein [Streptomyces sp. NPDC088923]|uniref:hypothetical protein n=1 Tax=Streptomyces sp. NPDC088923 TaxID=3365913 RepID=UPI00383062FF